MCVCLGVTPKSEAAFYRRVRFGFTIHAGTMLSFSAPVRRMFGALRGAGNFIGRIVLLHHILALASVHVYLPTNEVVFRRAHRSALAELTPHSTLSSSN
jgi:hypothetical protein